MGSLIMLFGTMLGFTGATFGYFFLDLGLLSALALWALSGPASAVIAVLASGESRSSSARSAGALSAQHPSEAEAA